MAEVDRFTSGELTITTLRVVGTMLPARMSGPEGAHRRPDWQMLAAIVEGPGGPWFFKATGPRASMARAENRFGRMLRTLRLERMP